MTRRPGSALPLADLASLLVLLALTAAFFFPLLRGYTFTTLAGRHQAVYPWHAFETPYPDVPQSDQATLTYPWRAFIARELRQGTLPLWNPLSFGGEPFFANGSSAILYPPNLIAAVALPLDWAHDLVSVLHVFLSGLCMYLLMREWQAAPPGALLSATAWMFSSFNMAWLHLEVVAPVALWLPLSLLLVSRAYRRNSWASTIGAGAALGCTLMSGHLLFCALVYGVAIVHASGLTIAALTSWTTFGAEPRQSGSIGRRTMVVARLVTIAIAPLAFAAIVLLPTVIFLNALGRESLPYEVARLGVRVPYGVFRYVMKPPALPLSQLAMHQMVYIGVLPALLAGVGFFRRGAGTLVARLLVVGVFLVATDTVLLRWVYLVFPKFSFFSPLGRLLNLFSFGMVILSGVGWNAALKKVLLPAAVVTSAVVGFTAWDLIGYARAINPTFVKRDPWLLYPATPMIEALRRHGSVNGTGPGRLFPVRQSQRNGWTPPVLFSDESLVFGIDSASGWDSALPSRAEDIWRIVTGEDVPQALGRGYRRAYQTSFEIDRVRFYMLPRMGITTIAGPPGLSRDTLWTAGLVAPLTLHQTYEGADGQVFDIDHATGGPWLVRQTEVVENAAAAATRFTDAAFDERRAVILERVDLPASSVVSDGSGEIEPSAVQVKDDGINTLHLVVRTPHSSWLVIPNVWEAGWHAWIDGRPAKVVRANYVLQAVNVGAGGGDVLLKYQPQGLWEGAAITLVSVTAALVVLWRLRRTSP